MAKTPREPTDGSYSAGMRELRRPPAWWGPLVAVGAGLLLSGLAGWPLLPAGIALGVVLIVRVLSFALPTAIRARAGVLAAVAGLVVLVAQSSVWAVLTTVGLVAGAAALTQAGRTRLVGGVVAAVIAAVGVAGLLVARAVDEANAAEQMAETSAWNRAQLLPRTPEEAVRGLVRSIADGDTVPACAEFTDDGARAFAARAGTPDCPTAVRGLHAQVVDAGLYGQVRRGAITTTASGAAPTLDGCHLSWSATPLTDLLYGRPAASATPGPQLGVVTVVPSGYGVGWLITDVRPC